MKEKQPNAKLIQRQKEKIEKLKVRNSELERLNRHLIQSLDRLHKELEMETARREKIEKGLVEEVQMQARIIDSFLVDQIKGIAGFEKFNARKTEIAYLEKLFKLPDYTGRGGE